MTSRMDTDPEYAAHVRGVVDMLPPLTQEQRERLGLILRPGVLALRTRLQSQARAERLAQRAQSRRRRQAVPVVTDPAGGESA